MNQIIFSKHGYWPGFVTKQVLFATVLIKPSQQSVYSSTALVMFIVFVIFHNTAALDRVTNKRK